MFQHHSEHHNIEALPLNIKTYAPPQLEHTTAFVQSKSYPYCYECSYLGHHIAMKETQSPYFYESDSKQKVIHISMIMTTYQQTEIMHKLQEQYRSNKHIFFFVHKARKYLP